LLEHRILKPSGICRQTNRYAVQTGVGQFMANIVKPQQPPFGGFLFALAYNSAMSEGMPDDRPPDASADRSRMHLQCIGSFKAHSQDGEAYTIEIWTHFGANSPLKNAVVAFFNLAKCGAKLRTARKITTCVAILSSRPCDGAARRILQRAAKHDRELARVSPSLLVLTTTDGRGVDRVDQGEYRLTDRPEISLSTDDPSAP
jgi:hypothetical protein